PALAVARSRKYCPHALPVQRAGKNKSLQLLPEAAFALSFSNVIGFAAHNAGIDGLKELRHGEIFGHKQKIECAIQPSDVAVNTDAEAENDFSHSSESTPNNRRQSSGHHIRSIGRP